METLAHTAVYIFVEIDRHRREKVEFHSHRVTGLEIKQKAGVPLDYELARIEGHRRVAVADGEVIEIRDGERFIAVPGGSVS